MTEYVLTSAVLAGPIYALHPSGVAKLLVVEVSPGAGVLVLVLTLPLWGTVRWMS